MDGLKAVPFSDYAGLICVVVLIAESERSWTTRSLQAMDGLKGLKLFHRFGQKGSQP